MSVPQKLLFVIDHFRSPNAGTEGQLYQLIAKLDRNKFEPELLVFRSSDWLRSHEFPCSWSELGATQLSNPRTWWRLYQVARAYRKRGFKLAHVFFNDPSMICPPVFRAAGIKTLISRRDMGYWYSPAIRRVLNITRYCVSGVTVNSRAVAEITMKSEGYGSNQVHVIYNGYEQSFNNISVEDGVVHPLAELKQKDRLLVGLVGNIRPIKRMQDAVQSLSLIAEACSKLDLVIIGDGDRAELEVLADRLGVKNRVHFLGARSDIQRCLSYLDIGILCSESEGFSNALIEYLMSGLPVIASNVGGNSEAVIEGETGYLYPCADTEQLAEKLHLLASNTQLRKTIGSNASNTTLKRFSVDKMISEQQQLYTNILSQS